MAIGLGALQTVLERATRTTGSARPSASGCRLSLRSRAASSSGSSRPASAAAEPAAAARLTLHLRTPHPEIFARTAAWASGEPVEIRDPEHGIEVCVDLHRQPAATRDGTSTR